MSLDLASDIHGPSLVAAGPLTAVTGPRLRLVSRQLCPCVQRAAIALVEKGAAFERTTIDLAAKPDWFLALPPLGKGCDAPIMVKAPLAVGVEGQAGGRDSQRSHGPRSA
jgi:hypothetical protein